MREVYLLFTFIINITIVNLMREKFNKLQSVVIFFSRIKTFPASRKVSDNIRLQCAPSIIKFKTLLDLNWSHHSALVFKFGNMSGCLTGRRQAHPQLYTAANELFLRRY